MDKVDLSKYLVDCKNEDYPSMHELVRVPNCEEMLDYLRKYGVFPVTDFAMMGEPKPRTIKEKLKIAVNPSFFASKKNMAVTASGDLSSVGVGSTMGAIPMISVKIPKNTTIKSFLATLFKVKIKEETETDVGELKDVLNTIKTVKVKKGYAHTIQFGEYPTNRLFGEDNEEMEQAFNEHREDFVPTGRTFSLIGSDGTLNVNAIRLCPEFIYNGKKYVRALQNNFIKYTSADEESFAGTQFSWVEVTPMTFYITNWDRLPRYINPTGSNKDFKMELLASEVYVGGMCYGYDMANNQDWTSSNICKFLDRGCYGKKTSFVHEAFNLAREPITRLYIQGECAKVPMFAFDSCDSIEKFAIDSEIDVSRYAFGKEKTQANYFFYSEEDDAFILCKNKPDIEELVYDFSEMKKYLVNADIGQMSFFIRRPYLLNFYNRLKKEKTFFSFPLIEQMEYMFSNQGDEDVQKEFDNIYLKHLKSLNSTLKTIIAKNENDEDFIADVYKVLLALGCATNKKIVDEKGRETEVFMAQKAVTLFEQINKRYDLTEKNFLGMLKLDSVEPTSQDCLKFLLHKDSDKLDNFELVFAMRKEYPNLFNLILQHYDRLSQYRIGLSDNGTPFKRNIRDSLIAFYKKGYYSNVEKEDEDLAEEFASKLIDEEIYNRAVRLRNYAIKNGVPHHLLGAELKEDTILSQIEKIRENTLAELSESKQLLQQAYDKEFTYEMLDKYDPRNFIIGLYADCCCTLTSDAYGKDIARSTVISDDVQNIVIRNTKGNIIAKASMYVSKDYGYAVINDFEINQLYRKDEQLRSGRYGDETGGKRDIERGKIFSAFMRGIHAFVKEYDKQNPDKPIKRVNVGMGYNRLKKYVEKFESAGDVLYVPTEYSFVDASLVQYVLYDANDSSAETLEKNESLWKSLENKESHDSNENN